MKKCSACKVEKPLTEFHKDERNKDKKSSSCKKCHLIRTKRWQKENKEKAKKIWRKWRMLNRSKAINATRRWRENSSRNEKKDKDKLKQQQRKYYIENKDKYRAHKKLLIALKRGIITKKQCEYPGCKSGKSEAHHWDYKEGKELEVKWLCNKHHKLSDQIRRLYETLIINKT